MQFSASQIKKMCIFCHFFRAKSNFLTSHPVVYMGHCLSITLHYQKQQISGCQLRKFPDLQVSFQQRRLETSWSSARNRCCRLNWQHLWFFCESMQQIKLLCFNQFVKHESKLVGKCKNPQSRSLRPADVSPPVHSPHLHFVQICTPLFGRASFVFAVFC